MNLDLEAIDAMVDQIDGLAMDAAGSMPAIDRKDENAELERQQTNRYLDTIVSVCEAAKVRIDAIRGVLPKECQKAT